MRAYEFLREYVDPDEAKKEILKKINDIDLNDDEQVKLLDRVYTIVSKSGITDRFSPIVDGLLQQEYNDTALKEISGKIVGSKKLNLGQKQQFVNDLEKRENQVKEEKRVESHIIDEDERRRQRARLYHERWQNQIKWEQK